LAGQVAAYASCRVHVRATLVATRSKMIEQTRRVYFPDAKEEGEFARSHSALLFGLSETQMELRIPLAQFGQEFLTRVAPDGAGPIDPRVAIHAHAQPSRG
jgi:hypothetical protein